MDDQFKSPWRNPILWPPKDWRVNRLQQSVSDALIALLIFSLIITVFCAILALFLIPYHAVAAIIAGQHDSVRNYLLSLGALLGVPFLIWRTIIAANQAEIGRESLYTQLFTSGVERLASEKIIKTIERNPIFLNNINDSQNGRVKAILLEDHEGNTIYESKTFERTTPNIEVRFGAVYALERVALDSKRDANSIMKTLSAYIRNNIQKNNVEKLHQIRNRPDIKAALEVLGRFPTGSRTEISYDLTEINLDDITLRNCDFSNCNLSKSVSDKFITIDSSFNEAIIDEANWQNLRAFRCNFDGTSIRESDFQNSYFVSANFIGANLSKINLKRSQILKSEIINSNITEVDLKECLFQTTSVINSIFDNVDISACTFNESSLEECYFINCDLSFSDMSKITSKKLIFEGCNLTRTKLPDNISIDMDVNFIVPEEWIAEQMRSQPFYEVIKFRAAQEWREWNASRQNSRTTD